MRLEEATDEFVRSIDIHTVLPHQEPFVMVGRLTHFSMESATTETVAAHDNLFTREGRFSAFGIMENIAQTCAARIGFYNRYILGKDVQAGVIGAIDDCCFTGDVKAGSTIETTIDIIGEAFGLTMARAEVTCCGSPVASARIKLATKDGEL